jgi:hypothetical protein
MTPRFHEWKRATNSLPQAECEFDKWAVVAVAGVIFADKSGELLVLRSGRFRLSLERQLERMKLLARSWDLDVAVMRRSSKIARVVIYRAAKVKEDLSRVPRWIFEEMGYPPDIEAGAFIQEVGRRWRDGEDIPPEIGFSLGYPVKDVLGFMKMLPLPYTGSCGWKIYGNPRTSLQKSREFRRAREEASLALSI